MTITSRTWLSVAGPLAVIALTVLLAPLGGASLISVASFGMIDLILVIGLYVFVGNTGVVSFGHAGFVAVGAYTGALTSISTSTKAMLLPDLPGFLKGLSLPLPLSILAAAFVAGFVALLLGIPIMRLNGLSAGIGTLAMLIIVRDVARNWKDVTGGAGTLNGIPIQASLPMIGAVAAIVAVVAFVYQNSRSGRRARSTSEDRIASQALGVNVYRERLVAFVLSATIAGAGGAVYASQLGAIAVDSFYLQLTFLLLAMLVIGGMRSIWGAVIGVLLVTVVEQGLAALQSQPGLAFLPPGLALIIVGVALIAMLLFRPQGITGGKELGSLLRRSKPQPDANISA